MYELLRGHTSFETALEVGDYPYGRHRTEIRYWLETADKGAKKGETRFMACTNNPKGGQWNKPKGSNYSQFGFMFRDTMNGHIHWYGLSFIGGWTDYWASFVATGLWKQVQEQDEVLTERIQKALKADQNWAKSSWAKHADLLHRIRTKISGRITLQADEMYADGFKEGDGYVYQPTFQTAFNQVVAEDYQRYTCPETK